MLLKYLIRGTLPMSFKFSKEQGFLMQNITVSPVKILFLHFPHNIPGVAIPRTSDSHLFSAQKIIYYISPFGLEFPHFIFPFQKLFYNSKKSLLRNGLRFQLNFKNIYFLKVIKKSKRFIA